MRRRALLAPLLPAVLLAATMVAAPYAGTTTAPMQHRQPAPPTSAGR